MKNRLPGTTTHYAARAFWAATPALALAAIWTGDARFWATAGVALAIALALTLIGAAQRAVYEKAAQERTARTTDIPLRDRQPADPGTFPRDN